MKWKICTLVLFLSAFAFVPVSMVSADSPIADYQDWMTAMHCGGMSPLQVQSAFTRFQNLQATKYQYLTSQMWTNAYSRDVNEFVRMNGCVSGAFQDDTLSFDFRNYLPIRILDFLDILPVQFRSTVK